jgi:hypothetical protein
VLDNEHIVSMNWTYSNLVGGVKVLVEAPRAAEAREVLATSATEVEEPAITEETEPDRLRCIRCGSVECESRVPALRFSILAWFAIGSPLGIPSRYRYCRRCGARA